MVELNASKGLKLTPGSAPTASAGTVYFDSSSTKLKVCNNGTSYDEIGDLTPVGCVMSWLKSYTNTPALSEKWVECNGQTLVDAESVYNGQVIPNLNGAGATTKRFLRGSETSGTTGGEDTHTLTWNEMPSHAHNCAGKLSTGTGQLFGANNNAGSNASKATDSQGGNLPHNILPSYYEVVWILKVK